MSPAPIPYGFGGVVPGSLGGNPVLPDMSRFVPPTGFNGVPGAGGNLAQLVSQLNLSPSGPTSAFPRVTSGWAGTSLLDNFTPSIPAGPSSSLLSEVPVAIRSGGGAFNPATLATLGEEGAAGAAAFAPKAAGLLKGFRNPLAGGLGGGLKAALGPAAAGIGLNMAGEAAGGDKSWLGRLLKGGSKGTLGFMFGPEVGIATTAGMGILGMLGGQKKDGNPVWLDDDVLNRAGFDDTDKAQIKLTYDILKETQGKEAANTAIGQLIMQDITTRQQQKEQDISSQRRMMATQALTAQFFQPFTKQMMDSAQQRYAVSESVAKDLPPEYRSVMRAANAASLDNANKVATAYASQAQLLPMMAAIDYQKGLADQLAQQQAATVIQNLYGGGTAGGGSLTDLAAQVGLQGVGK